MPVPLIEYGHCNPFFVVVEKSDILQWACVNNRSWGRRKWWKVNNNLTATIYSLYTDAAVNTDLRVGAAAVVVDEPHRGAVLPLVQALHVHDAPGGDHQLPVIGLSDSPILMPEQDRGRLVSSIAAMITIGNYILITVIKWLITCNVDSAPRRLARCHPILLQRIVSFSSPQERICLEKKIVVICGIQTC